MAKLFDSQGEQACPGEDECETFQRSAPDQPDEARCPSCPKRQSAGGRGQGEGEGADSALSTQHSELIDNIERLIRERDSGFGFPEDLTQLEKELVLTWDDVVAEFDRALKLRTVMMLGTLTGGS